MTDRVQAERAGQDLVVVVAAAVDAGARTVLLHEKDLPLAERTGLARKLARLVASVDGSLLVAGDADLARSVGATGVHLTAQQAVPSELALVARPMSRGTGARTNPAGHAPDTPGTIRASWAGSRVGRLMVGRSCHSVGALSGAYADGLDYATFSPIWATESKPGYGPALGLHGLAEAVAAVPELPIYALGGVGSGRVGRCLATGAAGVAVMGEVMRAGDPAGIVRALLDELASSTV